MMNDMSTFTECWKNFERTPRVLPHDEKELPWINELNQAVFAQLEKRLPKRIKIRTIVAPSFICYTEAAGGYGVDAHTKYAWTYRILAPNGSFEEHVESVTKQMLNYIDRPETCSVFFYMPIRPECEDWIDGTPNRRGLCVRMSIVEWTCD
jgi:hypothetical protein